MKTTTAFAYLLLALSFAPQAHAVAIPVVLKFSGTYDTGSFTIFGENGSAVPFEYSLTYDTSLDTNTEFFDAGVLLGGNTTTHQWHGYSASGIVSADLTFGTKTWPASSINPRGVGPGVSADIWFDTDIATGVTPTLSWMFFDELDGFLELGAGVSSGGDVFMLSRSVVIELVEFGFAEPLNISMALVPEPSAMTIGAYALIGLLGLRKRR